MVQLLELLWLKFLKPLLKKTGISRGEVLMMVGDAGMNNLELVAAKARIPGS